MPTGQPDSHKTVDSDLIEGYADRLIGEAMESGDFDDLPGAGKPLPGAGTPDDEGWWIRGWIERNSNQDQPPSSDS
jgi:hypothetical protein